uniref:uncharacterized protein LOC101307549 isoform X2 n=1 Tax=Fragaria vesca subsp. vesca TaxID=101020 RepID=UPI0005C83B16|nr:PREDICTED: uncharacterized protein LOC101307549 isoform X2 [Fragaria vesca subsp. vesca]
MEGIYNHGIAESYILEFHDCRVSVSLDGVEPSKAPPYLQAAKSRLGQATPYEMAVFDSVNCLIFDDRDDDVAFELHFKDSGNRAKEVHPLMSAMDETYNNICFLFKRTSANVRGASAFILLVIDYSWTISSIM